MHKLLICLFILIALVACSESEEQHAVDVITIHCGVDDSTEVKESCPLTDATDLQVPVEISLAETFVTEESALKIVASKPVLLGSESADATTTISLPVHLGVTDMVFYVYLNAYPSEFVISATYKGYIVQRHFTFPVPEIGGLMFQFSSAREIDLADGGTITGSVTLYNEIGDQLAMGNKEISLSITRQDGDTSKTSGTPSADIVRTDSSGKAAFTIYPGQDTGTMVLKADVVDTPGIVGPIEAIFEITNSEE